MTKPFFKSTEPFFKLNEIITRKQPSSREKSGREVVVVGFYYFCETLNCWKVKVMFPDNSTASRYENEFLEYESPKNIFLKIFRFFFPRKKRMKLFAGNTGRVIINFNH